MARMKFQIGSRGRREIGALSAVDTCLSDENLQTVEV